jgi:hypothetical protein
MGKNVMIPLALLERVIELLDGLDADRYGYNFSCEHEDVLRELKMKMQRLELRNAYGRIIFAEDEKARAGARIQYQRQRRLLGKMGTGGR